MHPYRLAEDRSDLGIHAAAACAVHPPLLPPEIPCVACASRCSACRISDVRFRNGRLLRPRGCSVRGFLFHCPEHDAMFRAMRWVGSFYVVV